MIERPRPSPELLAFTAEVPHERESILEFAMRAAEELPPGSRMLDVGAGNSPYRELFGHVRYESADWENSPHPGARAVDHIGPHTRCRFRTARTMRSSARRCSSTCPILTRWPTSCIVSCAPAAACT